MHGRERSPEQIRNLIEEVDRIRRETERVTSHVDLTMKRPFWPDRRKSVRVPLSEDPDDGNDAA
jgi:hypothetical protein